MCTPFVFWAVTLPWGTFLFQLLIKLLNEGDDSSLYCFISTHDSYRVVFEERRFISSRIWRATIHIESHLKNDDSYRVVFEERRFVSSRVWRATIPYRVALFRKAILVTVGLWGCLFAVIFVWTFAEACRNHSIACLKTSIDSFPIILRWSDLLARRRDHLSWDTINYLSRDVSDHFSFARCGRSFVARCEQSWLGWCERSWLGWCEWSWLVCAQLQEWSKTIAIFGEGASGDCYTRRGLAVVSRGTPFVFQY